MKRSYNYSIVVAHFPPFMMLKFYSYMKFYTTFYHNMSKGSYEDKFYDG